MEAVANRNKEMYEKDKKKFETRMFWLGWKQSEIEQMEKYLEGVN